MGDDHRNNGRNSTNIEQSNVAGMKVDLAMKYPKTVDEENRLDKKYCSIEQETIMIIDCWKLIGRAEGVWLNQFRVQTKNKERS